MPHFDWRRNDRHAVCASAAGNILSTIRGTWDTDPSIATASFYRWRFVAHRCLHVRRNHGRLLENVL